MKRKVYLICPVRHVEPREQEAITEYVKALEAQGQHEVHFPPRDVDQSNDDGGVRICQTHLEAMAEVDEVHVWWNEASSGSHFDLGMAYMLQHLSPNKHIPVVVVNNVGRKEDKSFQNVLVSLSERLAPPPNWEADSGERFLDHLVAIGKEDAEGLRAAFQSYGPSWKCRGGVGAFMMLARKWDRMENRVEQKGWDVFRAAFEDTRGEGVIDDIRDLRRYLMLCEAELRARGLHREHRDNKPNAVNVVAHEMAGLGKYNG